jgi:hypothetical protein
MRLRRDAATRALRAELQRLAVDELLAVDEVTGRDRLAEQGHRMRELRREHPHAIELIEEADLDRPGTYDFNCHELTFGLRVRDAALRPIAFRYLAKAGRNLCLGHDYVSFLIEHAPLTELDQRRCRDGDVAIYLSDGTITHSGTWIGEGRIRSKWVKGHLWKHALHEVPSSYGDEVRFYSAVTPPRCRAILEQYADAEPACD